jgi:hypothetical protein
MNVEQEKLGITVAIVILMLVLVPSACAEAIIINHTCTDLAQIPDEWLDLAKNNLLIAYEHTSHGSQLITGMNALMDFPAFGTKYQWSDDGSAGLHLADHGIGGWYDLSQGDWIDEYGVTPWVTRTRNLLNDPAHADINVIMWSWCSIDGHNITRYLENMEILVAEYPNVDFVFMTGHAEGQGEGGFIYVANQQIRQHCIDNDRILFDFADIESYDPDGNYYYDKPMWDDLDYNPGRTNNWGVEWCNAHAGSELEQLTTGVAGYSGCGDRAHSGSAGAKNTINCVLKGRATWWMMAQLATGEPATTGDIILNEIMYNPPGADPDHEWIELYNNNSEDIDITGWKFYEGGTNHGLTCAQGSMVISSGGYAIIAENATAFLTEHPECNCTVTDSSFSLKNTGEYIAVKNATLDIIDEVTYNASWGGDGNGKTLERNATGGWEESRVDGGTPCRRNSVLRKPPEITSFAPPSPVNDTVCTCRAFNVTINQTVNVSWYLNGSLQFTNVSVQEASCRLHADITGEHNVTAIASNANGTDTQTWVWNVSPGGIDDIAIFRNGIWCVDTTGDHIADLVFGYGIPGDVPLVGDFNKDGSDDIAIFRNGIWCVDTTGNHVADLIFGYGIPGDVPLVGDINKDGTDDIAIFRNGMWCVDTTGNHVADLVFGYGIAGDVPLVGDINQDGTDDIAIFRNGMWCVDTTGNRIADLVFGYGIAGDKPLVGDIDRDGTDDTAIFRNGMWCVDTTGNHIADLVFGYGIAGDVPLVGNMG